MADHSSIEYPEVWLVFESGDHILPHRVLVEAESTDIYRSRGFDVRRYIPAPVVPCECGGDPKSSAPGKEFPQGVAG